MPIACRESAHKPPIPARPGGSSSVARMLSPLRTMAWACPPGTSRGTATSPLARRFAVHPDAWHRSPKSTLPSPAGGGASSARAWPPRRTSIASCTSWIASSTRVATTSPTDSRDKSSSTPQSSQTSRNTAACPDAQSTANFADPANWPANCRRCQAHSFSAFVRTCAITRNQPLSLCPMLIGTPLLCITHRPFSSRRGAELAAFLIALAIASDRIMSCSRVMLVSLPRWRLRC